MDKIITQLKCEREENLINNFKFVWTFPWIDIITALKIKIKTSILFWFKLIISIINIINGSFTILENNKKVNQSIIITLTGTQK